jgi:hypothetical protein
MENQMAAFIIHVPEGVENESAYIAGAQAAIKRNASRGRSKKWLAIEGNQRLHDWLFQIGEFRETVKCNARSYEDHMFTEYGDEAQPYYHYCDDCRTMAHPLTYGMFSGNFGKVLLDMQKSLEEWGGLTEKQTEMVANALTRAEKWESERQAKFAAKHQEDLDHSAYVGVIGERRDWILTVERTTSYDNDFGTTYINVCKDEEGHTVVYKGSHEWKKGETLKVKATIKEHSEYNGVKQTLINRPKYLD